MEDKKRRMNGEKTGMGREGVWGKSVKEGQRGMVEKGKR